MKIRRKMKTDTPHLPLTAWLCYLLVCVLMITGVTFSSYVTSSVGGDSARVAKFSVEMTKGNDIVMDGTGMVGVDTLSGVYNMTITNNSEVAVSYTIEIVSGDPAALPVGIQLSMSKPNSKEVALTIPSDNNVTKFTFPGGDLAPGANATHELTITSLLSVTVNQNVQVYVHTQQID